MSGCCGGGRNRTFEAKISQTDVEDLGPEQAIVQMMAAEAAMAASAAQPVPEVDTAVS